MGHRGDWIQTYTGRRFFPADPRPEDVDVRDIAHSLSLLCRFNGHSQRFYSVAEHSLRVSLAVPAEHALWGLLHDAAEAYISDLPRPIKRSVPVFSELEERVLGAVLAAFGLSLPMPAEVRLADDRLLATELRDLMAPAPEPWPLRAEPLPGRIVPLDPPEAERAFLRRFEELRTGRGPLG